jgi:hypothetical protein
MSLEARFRPASQTEDIKRNPDGWERRVSRFKQEKPQQMKVGLNQCTTRRLAYHPNQPQSRRQPAVADETTSSVPMTLRPASSDGLRGLGQCLLATWVIGREAIPDEVCVKLTVAPFSCVVVILGEEVRATDAIAQRMKIIEEEPQMRLRTEEEWWGSESWEIRRAFHADKAVYKLANQIYIVIYKHKVPSIEFTIYKTVSRGLAGMTVVTLKLNLDHTRQNMKDIMIGILHVSGQFGMLDAEIEELNEWIVLSEIAVLTGYFGHSKVNKLQVQKIAKATQAIHCEPVAQWIRVPVDQLGCAGFSGSTAVADHNWTVAVAHPTWYMFFGEYRQVTWVPAAPVPWNFKIGYDLLREMVGEEDFPWWDDNQDARPEVRELGKITSKAVDFNRWCQGVIQTPVWIGSASQGRGAKATWDAQMRGKGGKAKGTQPQSRKRNLT